MKSTLFTAEQEKIIRDVYPLYGSPGVVAYLPGYTQRQVNSRAFKLGIKVQPGRAHHIARAARRNTPLVPEKRAPRRRAADIYSDVEQLAYARAWT